LKPLRALAILIFAQMLPATLVTAAIRPLFAAHHGGDEGAMHAFMAVNMLAAALAAPIVGPRLARTGRAGCWLGALALLDALLLLACAQPWPTRLVLGVRALEGAVHVSVATALCALAATRVKALGRPALMGVIGGAIMAAIALGNLLGGALVGISPSAPFAAGALVATAVAAALALGAGGALAAPIMTAGVAPPARAQASAPRRSLAPVLLGAFVARFTVGCLVVTFALFAHRVHGLSDRAIGGLFAALTVPFALATWPAAQLASRLGRARVLAAGAVGWTLVLFALPAAPTAALPALMMIGGLASAAIFAVTLGYATAPADAALRARAIARFQTAGALGMVVGPMAAGITAVIAGRGVAGDRAAFVLAGSAMAAWLVASAGWLVRAAAAERATASASRAPSAATSPR